MAFKKGKEFFFSFFKLVVLIFFAFFFSPQKFNPLNRFFCCITLFNKEKSLSRLPSFADSTQRQTAVLFWQQVPPLFGVRFYIQLSSLSSSSSSSFHRRSSSHDGGRFPVLPGAFERLNRFLLQLNCALSCEAPTCNSISLVSIAKTPLCYQWRRSIPFSKNTKTRSPIFLFLSLSISVDPTMITARNWTRSKIQT